jgi:hypothetical protein
MRAMAAESLRSLFMVIYLKEKLKKLADGEKMERRGRAIEGWEEARWLRACPRH